MKKIILCILSLCFVGTLFAQFLSREKLSTVKIKSRYPLVSAGNYLKGNDYLVSSILGNNDELVTFCWTQSKGKMYQVDKCAVGDNGCKKEKPYKQLMKQCYHQVISDGVVISYFVESHKDKFIISYEERRLTDMTVIRDEVIKEIDCEFPIKRLYKIDKEGMSYKLTAKSSPNNRYLVLVFDYYMNVGFSNYSISAYRNIFRIDALKHSMEIMDNKDEEITDKEFFLKSGTKIIVNNQGDIAVVEDIIKVNYELKKKIERFQKDEISSNEIVKMVLNSFYLKLDYFPIHGRTVSSRQTFSKYLPTSFDIAFSNDNKVLIYGFVSSFLTGHTNKMFTTSYNIDFDLFTVTKLAKVYGVDNNKARVDFRYFGPVELAYTNLKPVGITQLSDSTWVMFANWTAQASGQRISGQDNLYLNIVHFILNADGSIRSQGIHYYSYINNSLSSVIQSKAHACVKTDGKKAFLFTQVMNSSKNNTGKERLIKYEHEQLVKVITVDSNNNIEEQNMDGQLEKEKGNCEIMYGDPYYDELSNSWLVYILSCKECVLERWTMINTK